MKINFVFKCYRMKFNNELENTIAARIWEQGHLSSLQIAAVSVPDMIAKFDAVKCLSWRA